MDEIQKHHKTQKHPGEGFPIEAKIAIAVVLLIVIVFLSMTFDLL